MTRRYINDFSQEIIYMAGHFWFCNKIYINFVKRNLIRFYRTKEKIKEEVERNYL
jgi:hypothetical protein